MPKAAIRGGLLFAFLGAFGCGEEKVTVVREGWFDPAVCNFDQPDPELPAQPRGIGGTYPCTVTLSNQDPAERTITDIVFNPPVDVYAARIRNASGTLAVARGARLSRDFVGDFVVIFEPREVTDYATEMQLILDTDEAIPLQLIGSGTERPDDTLTIRPSEVTFGPVELGRRVYSTVLIQNLGIRELAIESIRDKNTELELEPDNSSFFISDFGGNEPMPPRTLDVDEAVKVDLHYTPAGLGPERKEIEFVLQGGENATLVATGEGVRPGALSCDKNRMHDFGQRIRASMPVSVVFTCTTDGPYTLQRIDYGPGSSTLFEVTRAPDLGVPIPVGVPFEIEVTFSPVGLSADHQASVLLHAAHGDTTEFIVRGTVLAPPFDETALTVVLGWDTVGTDLDLHVVRSGGLLFQWENDCFFESKNPDWGEQNDPVDDCFLDRDDTNGIGPEEINLSINRESTYEVYVHYYNAPAGLATEATVAIHLDGSHVGDYVHIFNSCGEMWFVGTARFPPGEVAVFDQDGSITAPPKNMCP